MDKKSNLSRITLCDDIHNLRPRIPIPITRVGISNVKRLISAKMHSRLLVIIGRFNVFIDLPDNLRGAHMSRSSEAINEAIWSSLETQVSPTEDAETLDTTIDMLCVKIARDILTKHEYAHRVEVGFEGDFNIPSTTAYEGRAVQEIYTLRINIQAERLLDGETVIHKWMGVEVTGATTCPCAQNEFRKRLVERVGHSFSTDQLEILMQEVPLPSHMQRARGCLVIGVPADIELESSKLVDMVKSSLSSQTFELLKRDEELEVVLTAFRNPRFAEDSARLIAQRVVEEYSALPDDATIQIRIVSEESIHKHDVMAEIVSNLGHLREKMEGHGGS